MTEADYIDPDRARFAQFRDLPSPGPIWMLNLLRFKPLATYPEGHANFGKGLSGAEAYRAYGRDSGPIFERVGGRQVQLATPELTLIGPEDEVWDLMFTAEYPNVDAFVAMVRDPDYRVAVVHRQAAVATSRLIRMQPRSAGARFGETAEADRS